MSRGGPGVAGSSRASDGTYRARPAVAAVGLGRQLPDEPGRLPSDRLELCSPSGLGSASCSRALPRPAPSRSPRALVCLVKGLRVASSYPELPRAALPSPAWRPALCHGKDASHRLLQPTPFTSTLRTARFPVAPPTRDALRRHAFVGTGSPWAGAGGRRDPGRSANRLLDEPTRWSFA